MGSSMREPTPPSAFGFGQGTQGYQAVPIFMKDGQAFTRTGGPAQSNYEHPMKRVLSGGSSSKGGVEPAPYSYQPISFGRPNQQANPAQSQAYGPGKYGVPRKYGEEANTASNYYQPQPSVRHTKKDLSRFLKGGPEMARKAGFNVTHTTSRGGRMPF